MNKEHSVNDETLSVVLSWEDESFVSDIGEPEDLIYEVSGEILECEQRSLVGKFRIYYVDIARAMNEGIAVFDVLDTYAHTYDYFDAMFGSCAPSFNEEVMEIVEYDFIGINFLILDRVEIFPQYRGQRLGLHVLRHMVERFSAGAAIVAMKPFPLQFEYRPKSEDEATWWENMGLDDFVQDQKKATAALHRYYEKLGFTLVPNTPFMVRSATQPF